MNGKANLIKIHGRSYVLIPEKFIDPDNQSYTLSQIDNKIIIEKVLLNDQTANENSITYFWDLAAENKERELFMNTVRPLLRIKLGYEYSELLCEEKAQLLCKKFYEAKKKGYKYEGPYLID